MEQHDKMLSPEEQYAQLAPTLDADGFSLYAAAEEVTGLKVYEEFPYEDNENQYDMLKQLWIVPVNKMAYFFSKFAVVLVYSICFMLVTATASILTGILSGYIPFDSESVLYLLRKCMEISLLTAFAVLPVLAVAAAQKGYILPVCLTLIYTFLGFILLMVNMYLHPLSSMTAIVMYDIPGVVFDQPLNIPAAFLCIGVWAAASAVLANVALVRRK